MECGWECAKSGRSKCQECKRVIAKDEQRMWRTEVARWPSAKQSNDTCKDCAPQKNPCWCVKDLKAKCFRWMTMSPSTLRAQQRGRTAKTRTASAKEFAQAEDAFLQLEREQCTHKQTGECNSVGEEIGSLSQKISAFRDYTPARLNGHIQQGTTCDAGSSAKLFNGGAVSPGLSYEKNNFRRGKNKKTNGQF